MGFIKLVAARDSDLAEDLVQYGYGECLDCLVEAVKVEDEDEVYSDDIGKVVVLRESCVTYIGSASGDCRANVQEATVFKRDDGTLWLAEEDYEDVFC